MVLNFITRNSIETKIATGLMLKQNLFEGVLDTDREIDEVDFSQKGHAQFLKELEQFINEFEEPTFEELEEMKTEQTEAEAESISDDSTRQAEEQIAEETPTTPAEGIASPPKESTPQSQPSNLTKTPQERAQRLEQMEQVMNQGMDFLAGLFKLSTGQEMNTANQKVEIDKETGEVVMRFKMAL